MELSPSLKSAVLPSPECGTDPYEKEISDDDDDDRNHKHRRRETRSQSLERDPLDQTLTQPYRKRNRIYENGQFERQTHFNIDRNFSKFDKRRVNISRFSGEHGFGRGRGTDFQRDSRFGPVDVASQMAHPTDPSAPWNGFGLLPAIPTGAIDAINQLGLPGILRPQLNTLLNFGIQLQRCRDFEERGFCLRGDMCPMEHGVNRIVVEDVQSLSQFNLPVSLSSAHVSAGSGFMPSIGVSSGTLLNSQGLQTRTSKSSVDDESLIGATNASGADVYDPDQPLWNNDGHETSTALLGLQPPPFDESESFGECDHSALEFCSSGAAIGSQSTNSSVWGRLNSKNKLELKEKCDSKTKPSYIPVSKATDIREPSSASQHLGKQTNGETYGTKAVGSTSKLQNDTGANPRKPAQKAERTLFVNHIPLKDNKKDNLLAHFRKFGDIIDIYIPANSGRAFVQFSKREEAERALQAPDAVMGSRFIKLWWANRDSVPNEGTKDGNDVITSQIVPPVSGSYRLKSIKDNLQHVATKRVVPKPFDGLATVGNVLTTSVNSSKATPPAQKNLQNLELLKEELRKKQVMLEQKRIEFRRQLDKLAKQATRVKAEAPAGQAAKRQKAKPLSTGVLKDANTKPEDANVTGPQVQADVLKETMVNVGKLLSQRSRTNSVGALQDHPNSKHTVRPVDYSATSFIMNRYKLDNQSTTFRINAPLPSGLANVVALREHFSTYGVVSDVEVENCSEEESPKGHKDTEAMKNYSARISFTTRNFAERAFIDGKSWRGYILQFIWLPSSITTSRSSGESSSALKGTLLSAEVQSEDKTEPESSESIMGHKECNCSLKSSNELSGDVKRESDLETQSPTNPANYIPLEADDPEIRDCEAQEEEESP